MCKNSKTRRMISLGFTAEKIPEGQHICYVYNDDAERLPVMAKFLESGMLAHEKLLYLVDTMTPAEMLDCLEELGVDVQTKAGNLTVAEAARTNCPTGIFHADEMLDTVRTFYRQAVDQEGYAGARGAGEMSWCLVEGRADELSLMEYEARLNQLLVEYPYTACCQYDARRFDGGVLMDVMAAHPFTILRGQLVRNPYFVEPEVFLKKYRARASG